MEDDAQPQWGLSDDGKTLLCELPTSPPVLYTLDAGQADRFIAILSNLRSRMADPVPAELVEGTRLEAVSEPAWRCEPTEHGTMLALRHPGFGWVGFILDARRSNEIAEWLVRLASRH